MITKQQLENAARAMGLQAIGYTNGHDGKDGLMTCDINGRHGRLWQPLSPTTQGKSDLMDLMLALKIDVEWHEESNRVFAECWSVYDGSNTTGFGEINDNEHAALAEAALSVASQIWESKQ